MLLTLDVGNTQIFAGVFEGEKVLLRFRRTSRDHASSDEYGLFLRSALRENQVDPGAIKHIVISSVVPEINYSLSGACVKYFGVRPLFLQAGIKTGLKIRTANPQEVGADLIAGAMAAVHLYPNTNLLVVDCGTANTFTAVNADRELLGVSIVPGLRLAVESLQKGTARLPTVAITAIDKAVGRTTAEAIQTGLYWQAVGTVKEMVHQLQQHDFKGQSLKVIGTGGLGSLLQPAGVFDVYDPDLLLTGLRLVYEMNTTA